MARRADHPSPEEARLSGATTEDAGHPMETENGVPLIIEYVETKDSQKPYLITQVTRLQDDTANLLYKILETQ